MIKKSKIKYLLAAFSVLLILLVIVSVVEKKKGDRTFTKELVSITPDDVTELILHPKAGSGDMIRLIRTVNKSWEVESLGKKYPAESSNIQSILTSLQNLEAQNLVSRSDEKWKEYEVSDSLAIRVQARKSGKNVADLYIGKFKFSQPRQMSTYVRLAGEKNTYSVEGFLAMTFNRSVNDFRSKTLVDVSTDNWTKLAFSYPADSSFALQKQGEKWIIGQQTADSALVANYLNSLKNLRSNNLTELEETGTPLYTFKAEGNNMPEPIIIECFDFNGEKLLKSNLNKGALFSDSVVASKIFVMGSAFSQ